MYCARLGAGYILQELFYRGEVYRLDDVVVETGFVRTTPIFFLSPAGQCHEYDAVALRLITNHARRVVAVHARHAEIEEHQFGLRALRGLERLHSVVCARHFMTQHLEHHRETDRRISIVVRNENAMSCCRLLRFVIRFHFAVRLRNDHERQPHDELSALSRPVATHFNTAAVHLHQLTNQRQTNSQPTLRTLDGAIDLHEDVEDVRQLVRRNSDTRVAHSDDDLIALLLRLKPDLASFFTVFRGVVKQV